MTSSFTTIHGAPSSLPEAPPGTRRRLARLLVLAMLAIAVLAPTTATAQPSPYAALLQAYRQSTSYLASTLQQSNRPAAIDALVTVLAVHRALTSAIDFDVARIQAASQRVEVGESTALTLVTTAAIERTTHIMFAGNWIGAANAQARQLALDGTATAVAATEGAAAALAPVLQRVQAAGPLPASLTLALTTSRQASGTFLVVVGVRNVGAEVAQGATLSLRHDDAINASQQAALGPLAPGASMQHVFAVALPAQQPLGTVSVTIDASNARSVVALADLE